MKYLSLFSGIGAFEKALKNLGVNYDLVGYSEIDKYASKSYSQIHNISESLNLGDITKINEIELPKVDLITYGFPCQDISVAGKQKGFESDGKQTRSGLFFDAVRIIKHCKPKVAIAENVKNLTSKRFKNEFATVLNKLDEIGYNSYWKILKASDYGIPQERERVFIVSIRKDIDKGSFKFPQGEKNTKTIKDFIENEVDEKFYLSKDRIEKIKNSTFMQEKKRIQDIEGNCATLLARDYKAPKCVRIGNIYGEKFGTGYAGNVWSQYGTSPTLTTAQGGNRQVMILEKEGHVRKLTPLEYWKLMGFTKEDFEKTTCSNTQLYKQAGNSIVVNVCESLLNKIIEECL